MHYVSSVNKKYDWYQCIYCMSLSLTCDMQCTYLVSITEPVIYIHWLFLWSELWKWYIYMHRNQNTVHICMNTLPRQLSHFNWNPDFRYAYNRTHSSTSYMEVSHTLFGIKRAADHNSIEFVLSVIIKRDWKWERVVWCWACWLEYVV